MSQLHLAEKIIAGMDSILKYDKAVFIEKLKLGDMPSDTARCDLEQLFGMTAYLRDMPIDGLVEKDRATLDESLVQIDSLFREIHDYDAAAIDGVVEMLRDKIRERADHLYDVTLPWRGMVSFLYEST